MICTPNTNKSTYSNINVKIITSFTDVVDACSCSVSFTFVDDTVSTNNGKKVVLLFIYLCTHTCAQYGCLFTLYVCMFAYVFMNV